MAKRIQELPMSERPYEKLELYGEKTLSNSELLAIIIESGTKDETSIQLAQRVISLGNSFTENKLRALQNLSLEELKKIKGIGRVKAIRLKAAFEIAKRLANPIESEIYVKSSEDVAKLFMEELRFEKREVVKILILNTKNKVLRIQDVSLGGTNSAIVEPKDILAEPIKMGANKIILLHNHPSGNATPSKEDFEVTKRIKICAEMFGITLPENFRQPFFSKNISDFWTRWHITLGTWFRDYIFYPVSLSKPMKKVTLVSRKVLGNHYGPLLAGSIALFLVWISNGLWHGAAWTYVFFGMYHFVLILLGNVFTPLIQKICNKIHVNRMSKPYVMIQIVKTTVLVIFGELFFRANTLAGGFTMFKKIFTDFSLNSIHNGSLFKLGCDRADFLIIGIVLLIIFVSVSPYVPATVAGFTAIFVT